MAATGDSSPPGDLWVAVLEEDTFSLLHRRDTDAADRFFPAARLSGTLATTSGPGRALAAAGRRLWLVYADRNGATVQWYALLSQAAPAPALRVADSGYAPSLPAAARLWSLTANEGGPWALLRIENPAVLRAVDTPATSPVEPVSPRSPPPPPDRPPSRQDNDGLEPPAPADDEVERGATAPPPAPAPATAERGADRLLRLDQGRWVSEPLPADWDDPLTAWLVMLRPEDAAPLIVAEPRDAEGGPRVYRRDEGGWARREHEPLAGRGARLVAAVAVDGQLMVAYRLAANAGEAPATGGADETEATALRIWLLGPELPIELATQRVTAGRRWALAPAGQTLALIEADSEGRLTWTRLDLQGHATTAEVLTQPPTTPLPELIRYAQITIFVLAMLLMFARWRGDPASNQPALPPELVPADLFRRVVAALIDLAPAVLAASVIFGIQPADWSALVTGNFEGMTTTPEALLYGLCTAVGLFVLYSGGSELLTGRTLGKRLFNLRVSALDGKAPGVAGLLTRNAFKAAELIAWPLLFLPLMMPAGRRFGDLIARTVVTVPRPPEAEEDKDQDEAE